MNRQSPRQIPTQAHASSAQAMVRRGIACVSPAIRGATLLLVMLAFLAAPSAAADFIGFISASSNVTEGNSGTVLVAIRVRRTGDGIGAVSVDWTTRQGTALPFTTTGISAIAAGNAHTVALKNDGTVVAWGDNYYGQTTVPVGLSGVSAISAGSYHTVALKNDGTVWAWGRNDDGQTTVPIGLSDVSTIAAGSDHTVALKTDGTVVAWGSDFSGQTTVPVGLNGVSAIAAGYGHTVALKTDGTVVAWGLNESGQSTVPVGLSGVSAIAAGKGHTLALKSDGTVVAWGNNEYGQTTVPVGLSGVSAISAGTFHSVALKADGTVAAWGSNGIGQAAVPAGLSSVSAIAAAYYHTVALKNDGTVVSWGTNYHGILSTNISSDYNSAAGTLSWADGDTTDKMVVVQVQGDGIIEPSEDFSVILYDPIGGALFLTAIHTVTITNDDSAGQLNFSSDLTRITEAASGTVPVSIPVRRTGGSIGAVSVDWRTQHGTALPFTTTGITAIAAGYAHTVALKAGGTVVAWGDNYYGQTTVPVDLSDVSAIAAGFSHTVALKTDGTVVSWSIGVPGGLSGVRAIAAGETHTVALKTDGTVVAWGGNNYGQTSVPGGLSGVLAIAAGAAHTVALKTDGTVVAWGGVYKDYGQSDVPFGLSGVSAIAAGYYHSVALKNDGTVVAWGDNSSGQTPVPVGLSGVSAIAAGGSHTVALKTDGTVVAWGNNYYGQTTVPVGLSGVSAIAAGGAHTVALKTDGTVAAWGANYSGRTTTQSSSDYLSATGFLSWADGDTADKIVTVQIQSDTEIESDETFSIVLANPTGSATLLNPSHTILITSYDPIAVFVDRFYRLVLQREPDAGGLAYWVNNMHLGTLDGARLALGFVLTPEFTDRNLSDLQFIDVLYTAFFDRPGDPGGIAYWSGLLASGVLREDVLWGFLDSAEFASLSANAGIVAMSDSTRQELQVRRFVRRFYVQCLQREGDAGGIAYWTEHLINGSLIGSSLAHNFFLSQEFLDRGLGDEQFVDILYATFFSRASDPDGQAFWLGQLGSSTRLQVLDGFIYSQEFLNLCAAYGIIAYSAGG